MRNWQNWCFLIEEFLNFKLLKRSADHYFIVIDEISRRGVTFRKNYRDRYNDSCFDVRLKYISGLISGCCYYYYY